MPDRLFTHEQVEFITEGPETVAANNRWNRKQKVQRNANDGLSQVFELLPDLLEYLDADRIQDEIEPAAVGAALGQCLTQDQRRALALTLIWGEKRPEENDAEFLERVPDIFDDYIAGIETEFERLRNTNKTLDFLRRISVRLWASVETKIEAKRSEEELKIAIPITDVVEFIAEQGGPEEPRSLPELVEVLYEDGESDPQTRYYECWKILLRIGIEFDIISLRSGDPESIEDKWHLGVVPTEEDIDNYLSVIDALDETIETYVEMYFEEEQIVSKDRVLVSAAEELEDLDRPAKDILNWEELTQLNSAWRGHHTERARYWMDDRNRPLLELCNKRDGRKEWEWTAFGRLVKELWDLDVDQTQLRTDGIPSDLDHHILEEAIATLNDSLAR